MAIIRNVCVEKEVEVEVDIGDFGDDEILEYCRENGLHGDYQDQAMEIYIAMIRKDPAVDSMVRKLIEEMTGRIL